LENIRSTLTNKIAGDPNLLNAHSIVSEMVSEYLAPVIVEMEASKEETSRLNEELKKITESKKRGAKIRIQGGAILTADIMAKAAAKTKKTKLENEIKNFQKVLEEKQLKLRGMESSEEKRDTESTSTSLEPYHPPVYEVGDLVIYRKSVQELAKIAKLVRLERENDIECVWVMDLEKRKSKTKDTIRVRYVLPKKEIEPILILNSFLLGKITLTQTGMIPLHSQKNAYYEALGLLKTD
jgi:hypothetical protein